MAIKQVNALEAIIVRQAFDKLADGVTFNHQTQRTLRQAAHELAEKATQQGKLAKQAEGGREGSFHAFNELHKSRSSIPLHPSVVDLVPINNETVEALVGPVHELLYSDNVDAAKQKLQAAVAAAIAPNVPADSVEQVAEAIVGFVETRRELMELAWEFPELAAV